jgi:ankyrin repeat protein
MATNQQEQFIEASKNGNLDELNKLIRSGVNVNERDLFGYTALIWAARKGHSACIHMLVEAGADVNMKNKYDNTSLMLAALYDRNACISVLIEAGADICSLDNRRLNKIIKNNTYTIDILRNTAFNRRKNALLFYKIRCLN